MPLYKTTSLGWFITRVLTISKGVTVVAIKNPAVNAAINYKANPSLIPYYFKLYLQVSYTPILVAFSTLALVTFVVIPL